MWLDGGTKKGLFIYLGPTRLQLSDSLQTVISHYQNKTQPDCYSKTLRPTGHVVLVLANTALITDDDGERTQRALQTLKYSHPDVQIIYVASENNAAHYTAFSNNVYANDLVIQTSNDIPTFVNQISEKLNTVAANVMNVYCNKSYVEIEDYITPYVDTLYEVHAEFLRRTDINIKVSPCVCNLTNLTEPNVCFSLKATTTVIFPSAPTT